MHILVNENALYSINDLRVTVKTFMVTIQLPNPKLNSYKGQMLRGRQQHLICSDVFLL